jgi:N-acetyl sugar amidotransferase
MDNIADPDISFDENGVSNYVHDYKRAAIQGIFEGEQGKNKVNQLVSIIKSDGKGKPYDCLIGLSGGVDSTYVAYLVNQLGLRPLAVHLDNGWNSELAVKNIESIVRKLGIDLFTLVVDWEEFRDIQLSYLKASVVDIEVVSDHAIFATMYKLARQHNIGYIISGTNIVTEHIMPPSWLYQKMDFANLKSIHDRYGKVKLKTYPYMDFKRYVYYSAVLRLTPVSILNYVPYNKAEVKRLITEELEWRDYGGKHYESLFTKFYQAHILPEKFKIDKRKAHLSTLICSGQITKASAQVELEKPIYDSNELKRDTEYVLKKLGLMQAEFDNIMAADPRPHSDFASDARQKRSYMHFLQRTQAIRSIFRKKKIPS